MRILGPSGMGGGMLLWRCVRKGSALYSLMRIYQHIIDVSFARFEFQLLRLRENFNVAQLLTEYICRGWKSRIFFSEYSDV